MAEQRISEVDVKFHTEISRILDEISSKSSRINYIQAKKAAHELKLDFENISKLHDKEAAKIKKIADTLLVRKKATQEEKKIAEEINGLLKKRLEVAKYQDQAALKLQGIEKVRNKLLQDYVQGGSRALATQQRQAETEIKSLEALKEKVKLNDKNLETRKLALHIETEISKRKQITEQAQALGATGGGSGGGGIAGGKEEGPSWLNKQKLGTYLETAVAAIRFGLFESMRRGITSTSNLAKSAIQNTSMQLNSGAGGFREKAIKIGQEFGKQTFEIGENLQMVYTEVQDFMAGIRGINLMQETEKGIINSGTKLVGLAKVMQISADAASDLNVQMNDAFGKKNTGIESIANNMQHLFSLGSQLSEMDIGLGLQESIAMAQGLATNLRSVRAAAEDVTTLTLNIANNIKSGNLAKLGFTSKDIASTVEGLTRGGMPENIGLRGFIHNKFGEGAGKGKGLLTAGYEAKYGGGFAEKVASGDLSGVNAGFDPAKMWQANMKMVQNFIPDLKPGASKEEQNTLLFKRQKFIETQFGQDEKTSLMLITQMKGLIASGSFGDETLKERIAGTDPAAQRKAIMDTADAATTMEGHMARIEEDIRSLLTNFVSIMMNVVALLINIVDIVGSGVLSLLNRDSSFVKGAMARTMTTVGNIKVSSKEIGDSISGLIQNTKSMSQKSQAKAGVLGIGDAFSNIFQPQGAVPEGSPEGTPGKSRTSTLAKAALVAPMLPAVGVALATKVAYDWITSKKETAPKQQNSPGYEALEGAVIIPKGEADKLIAESRRQKIDWEKASKQLVVGKN